MDGRQIEREIVIKTGNQDFRDKERKGKTKEEAEQHVKDV